MLGNLAKLFLADGWEFDFNANFTTWSGEEWLNFGISVFVIIYAIILLFILTKAKYSTRSLVYGAVCVAMAFVLNLIKTPSLLYGGSVTLLRSLPLVIYAYMFGTAKGISASAVYGVLDLFMSGWIMHPVQVLLDYILGFACIGLAGLFREKKLWFVWGPLVAMAARYACLVVSGVVFWGSGMLESEFSNVWLYSLAYNSISLIDMALVIAALSILNGFAAFRKLLLRQKEENYIENKASEQAI